MQRSHWYIKNANAILRWLRSTYEDLASIMVENRIPPSIQRLFRDLSDAEVADIEKASQLARVGWTGSFGWEELLRSQRILIVSEAGAGKTYECRTQQERLWKCR